MRKLNKYHSIGLLLICFYLLLNHTTAIPEFIKCVIFGAGFGLTLVGIYAYNHDMSKIKNFKKNIFAKVFKLEM